MWFCLFFPCLVILALYRKCVALLLCILSRRPALSADHGWILNQVISCRVAHDIADVKRLPSINLMVIKYTSSPGYDTVIYKSAFIFLCIRWTPTIMINLTCLPRRTCLLLIRAGHGE